MHDLWFVMRRGGQPSREARLWRELGQLCLADGLVEGGAGRNRQQEQIAALVDWTALERLLGAVYLLGAV